MKLTEFGRAARDYRMRHGWLLYDMAQIFRISSATLSSYETGRKEPPEDMCAALSALIRLDKEINYDKHPSDTL